MELQISYWVLQTRLVHKSAGTGWTYEVEDFLDLALPGLSLKESPNSLLSLAAYKERRFHIE